MYTRTTQHLRLGLPGAKGGAGMINTLHARIRSLLRRASGSNGEAKWTTSATSSGNRGQELLEGGAFPAVSFCFKAHSRGLKARRDVVGAGSWN